MNPNASATFTDYDLALRFYASRYARGYDVQPPRKKLNTCLWIVYYSWS